MVDNGGGNLRHQVIARVQLGQQGNQYQRYLPHVHFGAGLNSRFPTKAGWQAAINRAGGLSVLGLFYKRSCLSSGYYSGVQIHFGRKLISLRTLVVNGVVFCFA
jgi:hypothetical protein